MRISAFMFSLAGVLSEVACGHAEPTVPIQITFTMPAPVPPATTEPLGGIVINVHPKGSIEAAKLRGVTNIFGVAQIDMPLSWFAPTITPQSIEVEIDRQAYRGGPFVEGKPGGWGEFGAKFALLSLAPVVFNGPFVDGVQASFTFPLLPAATVSGLVPSSVRTISVYELRDNEYLEPAMPRSIDVMDGVADGTSRRYTVVGFRREPRLPILVESSHASKVVFLNTSAGTADWGSLDLSPFSGDANLRLKVANLPSGVSVQMAQITRVADGRIRRIASRRADYSLASDGGSANGVNLLPGQYAIAIGAVGERGMRGITEKLDSGLPLDPTKIAVVTLTTGQTTELTLDWNEWFLKTCTYLGVDPAAVLERSKLRLPTPPAPSQPLYTPPAFRWSVP